jgi:predicted metal-binding transcription factor (methanogenesis marker protein 9)
MATKAAKKKKTKVDPEDEAKAKELIERYKKLGEEQSECVTALYMLCKKDPALRPLLNDFIMSLSDTMEEALQSSERIIKRSDDGKA